MVWPPVVVESPASASDSSSLDSSSAVTFLVGISSSGSSSIRGFDIVRELCLVSKSVYNVNGCRGSRRYAREIGIEWFVDE